MTISVFQVYTTTWYGNYKRHIAYVGLISCSISCNDLKSTKHYFQTTSCVQCPGEARHKISPLRWRNYGRDGVSNHQPHDFSLKSLFGRRSKKTSKFRVTGLCAGNSPGTDEFPAQMASNAENIFIWWRHHGIWISYIYWVLNRACCTPKQLINFREVVEEWK